MYFIYFGKIKQLDLGYDLSFFWKFFNDAFSRDFNFITRLDFTNRFSGCFDDVLSGFFGGFLDSSADVDESANKESSEADEDEALFGERFECPYFLCQISVYIHRSTHHLIVKNSAYE